MSDLIERLRNFDPVYRDDDVKLMAEAADRLAELERCLLQMQNANIDLAKLLATRPEPAYYLHRLDLEKPTPAVYSAKQYSSWIQDAAHAQRLASEYLPLYAEAPSAALPESKALWALRQIANLSQTDSIGTAVFMAKQALEAPSAAFEAHFQLSSRQAKKDNDGEYISNPVRAMWQGWQAAQSNTLDQLRSDIKDMQDAAYTFGDYSKEAVRIALDGVLDAIDAIDDAAAPTPNDA